MITRLLNALAVPISILAILYVWLFIPDETMKFNEKITFSIAAVVMAATWIGAESSRRASIISEKTLENNLINSRLNYFEQQYNSLMTLHNNLHTSVCEYLDSDDKFDNNKKLVSLGGKSFFKNIRRMETLEEAHNTLMGHSVVSPYMRVLYHLLKHIFTFSDEPVCFKKYTSPLRSLIRNDVIYLIALNASIIYKEKSNEYNGYEEYQRYLQKCKFFEHGIFLADEYKKFDEIRKRFDYLFMTKIESNIKSAVKEYIDTLEIHEVSFELPKDLILCMIYDNPFSLDIDNKIKEIYKFVQEVYEIQMGIITNKIAENNEILNSVCGYCEEGRNSTVCWLVSDPQYLRGVIFDQKDNFGIYFIAQNGELINAQNMFYYMEGIDKNESLVKLHNKNKKNTMTEVACISQNAKRELKKIISENKVAL